MTKIEQALSEIKRRAVRTDLLLYRDGSRGGGDHPVECICITEDEIREAIKEVFGDDSVLDPEARRYADTLNDPGPPGSQDEVTPGDLDGQNVRSVFTYTTHMSWSHMRALAANPEKVCGCGWYWRDECSQHCFNKQRQREEDRAVPTEQEPTE